VRPEQHHGETIAANSFASSMVKHRLVRITCGHQEEPVDRADDEINEQAALPNTRQSIQHIKRSRMPVPPEDRGILSAPPATPQHKVLGLNGFQNPAR
jgi:hypothetical protein